MSKYKKLFKFEDHHNNAYLVFYVITFLRSFLFRPKAGQILVRLCLSDDCHQLFILSINMLLLWSKNQLNVLPD